MMVFLADCVKARSFFAFDVRESAGFIVGCVLCTKLFYCVSLSSVLLLVVVFKEHFVSLHDGH